MLTTRRPLCSSTAGARFALMLAIAARASNLHAFVTGRSLLATLLIRLAVSRPLAAPHAHAGRRRVCTSGVGPRVGPSPVPSMKLRFVPCIRKWVSKINFRHPFSDAGTNRSFHVGAIRWNLCSFSLPSSACPSSTTTNNGRVCLHPRYRRDHRARSRSARSVQRCMHVWQGQGVQQVATRSLRRQNSLPEFSRYLLAAARCLL